MNHLLALSLIGFLQGSAAGGIEAQGQPAPRLQTFEACRVYLTEAGRTASFQGTAIYEVVSDSDGKVLEVRPLNIPQVFNKFVQLAEFRACVQRWQFNGAGTTRVGFSVGTTGEFLKAWKISVTSGAEVLNLVLPR